MLFLSIFLIFILQPRFYHQNLRYLYLQFNLVFISEKSVKSKKEEKKHMKMKIIFKSDLCNSNNTTW